MCFELNDDQLWKDCWRTILEMGEIQCIVLVYLFSFPLLGFKSIHDSLSSLQQIQKTKMDLEKYKVQKDLKKLQRKIVELQEV